MRKPRFIKRGFSLLEVIIVCVMLVIVAAMALPRFIVVERQREEKAIGDVEDLMRMFAFRNAAGTQQIALHYEQASNEVSLWIMDLNPNNPEGARIWQQDRLSTPVELPEGMIIDEAMSDDSSMHDETWTITTHPDGSRPRIGVSLKGRNAAGLLLLETYSTVPVRADDEKALVRQPVDLDREGRSEERW